VRDSELIEKIKTGDVHSFKVLFEKYQESIYNLCFRFVNSKEEAEDLCQDVFFKIYRVAQTFQHKSQLSTWIYRITVNFCLNHQRKRKRYNWLSLGNSEDQIKDASISNLHIPLKEQPDQFVEIKEREKIVQNAINTLPKNQRMALILQRYEGMSIQEVAGVLDCSVSSIQSRLARAKENLAKKLFPIIDELK